MRRRWRYLLHSTDEPVEPTDPRVITVLDVASQWGEGLHPILVGQEIAKRLELARSDSMEAP